MDLKVALLQLIPEDTLDKQLNKGVDACRKAKAMGDKYRHPEKYDILTR